MIRSYRIFCVFVAYACGRSDGTLVRTQVIESICECRSGEWRRGDAFLQGAYSSIKIQPSVRLDDRLQPDDMLAGSGKVTSFNRNDWTTAVSRGHDIYIVLEDDSALHDVIVRRIRFNAQWVQKVELQVLKVGHFGRTWKSIAKKPIPKDDRVTEVDFKFASRHCKKNCYGLEGWLIRILLQPVDVWHVAEIEGLVFDLCQSKAAYDAIPKLECLQTPDGKDYVGDLNKGVSGRPCLLWSSSDFYTALRLRFPDGLYGAANRCRNPSFATFGPFCLNMLNGKVEKEPCHLSPCTLPKISTTETTCEMGETSSFFWGSTDGVQVASSVTLRSETGGPINEMEIFSWAATVLMADEVEWSGLPDPSFDLIFAFEQEMVISAFTIFTANMTKLTLHHSKDGRQWTPSHTLDIPVEKKTTLDRSSWRFTSSACLFKCSGIKATYIRLILVGVGLQVVPKLAGVDIMACRPFEDLQSVCEFGPSRTLDLAYAQHVDLYSNLAMLNNIENILYEMNETLYVRADPVSFRAILEEAEEPFVELSLRSSRSFTVKSVTIQSWFVRKVRLLGSMDGRRWNTIKQKIVIHNGRLREGSPSHSRFWPKTIFRLEAGKCPHSCRGVRLKYLRFEFDGGESAQAPWFRGLKLDTCFDQDVTPPTVECKSTTNGLSYSGRENRSSTGLLCLPWKDSLFWRHSDFPDGTVTEASNYCRHPDTYYQHPRGPWCYTEYGDKYCDIPIC
ncbi:uncharacterized protein LOC135486600 [Lineus longissimus]|uniref:uncharacterized protein LOC135486600 n=1 Tax=Lineus longissimus TaxID=88925 RepID=UPI002B4F6309